MSILFRASLKPILFNKIFMIKTLNNVLDDLMFLNFRIPQATFYEVRTREKIDNRLFSML